MSSYIFVIDDDPTLAKILSTTFKDFEVIPAYSLAEAHEKLELYSFSAIFFDIELPDGDGLTLLAEITSQNKFSNVPLFVLSSHSEMANKLAAFSLGVDDFISKPFSPLEVQARLMSRINKFRLLSQNQPQVKVGNALLDFSKRTVYSLSADAKTNLNFTNHEFMIFAMLANKPGSVFSREEVLEEVWDTTNVSSRGVDSHIARMRSKLTATNVKINAIKGFGYNVSVE